MAYENIIYEIDEGIATITFNRPKALNALNADYKIAFIVAGTDVLKSDRLGGMNLTIDDVVRREHLTLSRLKELKLPAVFLGAGGYSKESANATAASIRELSQV